MKVALVGYGKMGHNLRRIAESRGHTVVVTIDPYAADADVKSPTEQEAANAIIESGAEGIIEFTHPDSVMKNIQAILPTQIPVVVGTTGWNDKLAEVEALAKEYKSHLLTSANFSIGVNMFYRMVSQAVELMNNFEEYDCAVWEAHHNQKADSPSGTAIDVAKKILEKSTVKKTLVVDAFHQKPQKEELHVSSTRVGSVPGTHTVYFDSPADTIELTHTARNRDGFAIGAVRSLEWLVEAAKKNPAGLYSFEDVLNS